MAFLVSFALAGLALFGGAVVLWFAAEMLKGKQEFILHFGNVLLVTVIGLVLFPIWGWWSTVIVLGFFGLVWIGAAVVQRLRS